jgi:hypothetical protein
LDVCFPVTKRLFVAIDLPDSTQQSLTGLDPHIRGVRWTEPDQMHLTLGFFGDVAEDVGVKLQERLGVIEFGAFFLPVNGVGMFSSKRAPKIIWISKFTNACRKLPWPPVSNRSCAPGIRTSRSRVAEMSPLKLSGNSCNRMPSSTLE